MKMTTTKPFPATVKRWGETWNLIEHGERAILYERTADEKRVGFIVCKARFRERPDTLPDGTVLEVGAPLLPHAESFGKTAWNYLAKSEAAAKSRFQATESS